MARRVPKKKAKKSASKKRGEVSRPKQEPTERVLEAEPPPAPPREPESLSPREQEAAALEPEPSAPRPSPLEEFFLSADEGGGGLRTQMAEAPDADLFFGDGEASSEAEFLCFDLADEVYAVPVGALREIVKPPPITKVPRTPDYLLGVITLRGAVFPVFDLRLRLGLKASQATRGTRIMVIETIDGKAGILADRVREVIRMGDAPLEPPPIGLGGGGDYLEGILRRDGEMIIVLDISTALDSTPAARREGA